MAATLDSVVQELQAQRTESKNNSVSVTEVMGDVRNRVGMSNSTLLDMVGNVRRVDRNIVAMKNTPSMSDELVASLVPLNMGIRTLVSDTKGMLSAITSPAPSNPDDLETEREESAYKSEVVKLLEEIRDRSGSGGGNDSNDDTPKKSGGFRIGQLLSMMGIGGIFAAISGAATGFVARYIGMFDKIGNLGTVIVEKAASIGKSISDAIGRFSARIKNIFTIPANSALGKASQFVTDIFGSKGKNPIVKMVEKLAKMGSGLGQFFGKFSKIFAVFFRLGGSLMFPLTAIVMTVKNIVKSFTEGLGFFETLKNIIDDMIKFLVTDLLDLIKDGISWVSSKLGFDNFSEMLDSFSFSEIYQKLSDALLGPITEFADSILNVHWPKMKEGISEIFSGNFVEGFGKIIGAFTGFIGELFAPVLKIFDRVMENASKFFTIENVKNAVFGGETVGIEDLFNFDSDPLVKGDPQSKKTGSEEVSAATKEQEELNRTSSNVVIMDNSNNSTNTSGGGGGSTVIAGAINGFDLSDPMFSTR